MLETIGVFKNGDKENTRWIVTLHLKQIATTAIAESRGMLDTMLFYFDRSISSSEITSTSIGLHHKNKTMEQLAIEQKLKTIAAYMDAPIYKSWLNYPETVYPHWHAPQYHTSYDAIMPVVKKVMDELLNIGNLTLNIDTAALRHQVCITRHSATCYEGIEPLFEETVKAIQYINSIKSNQS